MPESYILSLASQDATLITAGGKGMSLARLASAGLPVPQGFIVATDAYRAFVNGNDLHDRILEIATAIPQDDPTALDAASRAIRERFSAGVMTPSLSEPLIHAYANLGQPAVAVRSSATAEDLSDMSFAGQQDTFLNVRGDQALLRAVVDCWSSLWTARAIAYRDRSGIPHDEVALAVIVQAMVQSEASGVLFTANPLTGKRSEAVIDATLGLGEALVGGHVEPDTYLVDVSTGRILAKTLGAKAVAVRSRDGGGTVMVEMDASSAQALPDEAIVELVMLGQQIVDLYEGQPQDIEWAWAGARLYLLQSRPITSLYPVPSGLQPEPLQVLFSLNHVQGMLDPFTPLGQDMLRELYVKLVTLFGRDFTVESQREVIEAGERLYGNITPMIRHGIGRKLALGITGAIEPGIRQALEPLLDDPRLAVSDSSLSPRAALQLALFLGPILGRAFLALRDPRQQRSQVLQLIELHVRALEERSLQTTTLLQRLKLIRESFAVMPQVAPYLFPPLAVGIGSFFQLRRLASNQLGSDRLALEAARALPNNVTTEMDLTLWTVAQVISRDPESAACFADQDAGTLSRDYEAGQLPLAAQVAVAAFLDRYGMRGLAEIDIGRPRWQDDPTHVMQVIQGYLQIREPEMAPDVVFRRGAFAAQAAIEEIVKAMDNPIRARLARLFANRMRALAGLRETPKFSIIRLMGVVRRQLLLSGRELVQAGVLTQPDDVFFLHLSELEAMAAGRQRNWEDLVTRRRKAYEREMLRRQVPRLLLSDGRAYYEGLGAGDPEASVGVLVGSPVSPGVVEGAVRVVFDPQGTRLAPGEILVCRGTDPSWTPLFLAAGGLVMEVGGLMTHGSVVAREYGIPAIVGVHQATQRLRTGQRIRVDGSAGLIAVLDVELDAAERP